MFMLLKKKVKAGILMYALLMLAIFSLLLQFYLNRQEASASYFYAQRESSKAYFMAQMTLKEVETDIVNQAEAPLEKNTSQQTPSGQQRLNITGSVDFTEGTAMYQQEGQFLNVQVHLDSNKEFSYAFPIPSQN
ncbi:TPA: competence type IV pilus minor pilin ComGG [Streptococcus suis]